MSPLAALAALGSCCRLLGGRLLRRPLRGLALGRGGGRLAARKRETPPRLRLRIRRGLLLDARHELDEHHRRAVAHPTRQARRAGEAGGPIGVARREIGEELLHYLLLR